ncbi:MAG: thiamine phosphate synthase [Myxococcales bacterium]|nr:thiamine phosphate synthase [Myxococcales bacterium]
MSPLPFRLIVITDWSLGREKLLDALGAACSLGPGVAVQLRHPEAKTRELLEEGKAVAEVCSRFGNALFVNGRLDLALLLGAHLHLSGWGVPPASARAHLDGKLLSVAVHQGEEEAAAGADMALVSPVFPAGSKPTDPRPPLGPHGFSELAARLPCPSFALGGIGPDTARRLAGRAAGAAAVSGVLRAADPKKAAAAILSAM